MRRKTTGEIVVAARRRGTAADAGPACTETSVERFRPYGSRTTPDPSSTVPTRARKSSARPNSASSESAFSAGQRHEQATRGLRVVREREELVGHAAARHVSAGEVAVARVAAGADAGPRGFERALERRQRGGAEPDPDAAPFGRLVGVAEQTEARHVGDRVRRERRAAPLPRGR